MAPKKGQSTKFRKLPDTNGWQPKESSRDNLGEALMFSCQFAQKRIVAQTEAEIRFNSYNFDSGSGVEDIVREEFDKLLPGRYSVNAGVVNDRHGKTAGDCDMLIRDHLWSPTIKPGATNLSRRRHFPIEAIYAAAEIKQTLGLEELDKAMEKLVKLSRLDRPENPYGHITENQHFDRLDQPNHLLNPLHTCVLATRLQEGLTFDEISKRFGDINALLSRENMVTMLCVLDVGTAWYSVESGEPYNADFMRDRNKKLVLQVNGDEPDDAFYRWYVLLMDHLTRSVLYLVNVSGDYGKAPPDRTDRSYPDARFNQTTAPSANRGPAGRQPGPRPK